MFAIAVAAAVLTETRDGVRTAEIEGPRRYAPQRGLQAGAASGTARTNHWRQQHANHHHCSREFSETDFIEDLKRFDVVTLILHGRRRSVVPIGASALLSSKLVKGATLKVNPGAPHGMCSTLKDKVNADPAAFIRAQTEGFTWRTETRRPRVLRCLRACV